MAILKTKYDEIMEEFESQGKVKIYTDEENDQILKSLNEGMSDFLAKEQVRQVTSREALRTIILD